jgi:hypothetical protein
MRYESIRYIFTVAIRHLILEALKKLQDHFDFHGSKFCQVSIAQGTCMETVYMSVWIVPSSLIQHCWVYVIPYFFNCKLHPLFTNRFWGRMMLSIVRTHPWFLRHDIEHRCNSECWAISLHHRILVNVEITCYFHPPSPHQVFYMLSHITFLTTKIDRSTSVILFVGIFVFTVPLLVLFIWRFSLHVSHAI